jgi:hypothetical protein
MIHPSGGQLHRPPHDGIEHGLGQLAGEGVLLAGVVAPHQPHSPDIDFRAVSELGLRVKVIAPLQDPQDAVPREGAQRDHDFEVFERRDLAPEERQAGIAFDGRRFVARRRAPVDGTHEGPI